METGELTQTRLTLTSAVLVLLLSAASLARAQSSFIRLTDAQRTTLDRGASVVQTHSRPESSWPAVTVLRYVEASPEEVAAVFVDYNAHHTYMPDLKWSRIRHAIDPTTVDVDYVVSLPVVSDERYTVRNRLRADSGSGFRVDWTLVRAESTNGTTGHARFLPYVNSRTGRTGTLLEYYNFVTPGSRLAGLGYVKNRAIRQVEEVARALAEKVENDRRRPEALAARVASLRAALASSR